MAETLVLGRHAMGETLRQVSVIDRRRIWRDGKPVLVEPLKIDRATLMDASPAGLAGARAVSTLALVAKGAEDALGAVRALSVPDGVSVAVSAWNGRCVVRLMARDPAPLRRALARAIETLGRRALPRVWQM